MLLLQLQLVLFSGGRSIFDKLFGNFQLRAVYNSLMMTAIRQIENQNREACQASRHP